MNKPVTKALDSARAASASRPLSPLRALWRWAVQTARLCCGVPDYDAYVAHLRRHHPERPVPDYATFFAERQQARYRGTGGRCC